MKTVRKTVLLGVATAGLGFVAACGDVVGAGDPPLSGKWVALCGVDVSCVFQLEQHGTAITGRFGERSILNEVLFDDIAGTFAAPAVHLEWKDGQVSESFDGTMVNDSIVGTLRTNGNAGPKTLFRDR